MGGFGIGVVVVLQIAVAELGPEPHVDFGSGGGQVDGGAGGGQLADVGNVRAALGGADPQEVADLFERAMQR